MTPDPVDEMLKRANPYLDDAGFTARVMERLPRPRAASGRVRAWVLAGSALAATAVALLEPARALASGTLGGSALVAFTLSAAVVAATAVSVVLREAER